MVGGAAGAAGGGDGDGSGHVQRDGAESDPNYGGDYSTLYDRIRLNNAIVYGEDGFFVAMHEYGHAYQWGAIDQWYSYSCNPSTHYISVANTPSCAFVEGFADFLGVWIPGDSISNRNGGARYTDYEAEQAPYRGDTDGDPDGARIEGAVASFFYDLVDGPADPDGYDNESGTDDDSMTGSAYDLATILRSCTMSALPGGTRDELDGVDQVVYCTEGSLYAQTNYPQYFKDRTEYFYSLSSPRPASWSRSVIRAIWLYDLYSYVQPPPPPPPPPPSDSGPWEPPPCGGSVAC